MIETIDLSRFELCSNHVLVKADPNFDITLIDGPEGKKVKIYLIDSGEHAAQHFSITGTVIKMPKSTYFFDKKAECGMFDFRSRVQASLQVDGDFPFNEGDKIYYNYNTQLSCEEEFRVVDTEEHGLCLLVKLDSLFGYEKDGKIIPVNGYVFFIRDQQPEEVVFESGLIGIQKPKHYASNFATIVSSSEPVRNYMDHGSDSKEIFSEGDRVVIDHRFGYKMAYDLHAGEIKNVEVCYRRHVIAKLEAVA